MVCFHCPTSIAIQMATILMCRSVYTRPMLISILIPTATVPNLTPISVLKRWLYIEIIIGITSRIGPIGVFLHIIRIVIGIGVGQWKHTIADGIGGSKGGMRDVRAPGVQILSLSCSFRENLAKSCVGATPRPGEWGPYLGEIRDPPLLATVWNQFWHDITHGVPDVCGFLLREAQCVSRDAGRWIRSSDRSSSLFTFSSRRKSGQFGLFWSKMESSNLFLKWKL